jgi:hypothetical protein
MTLDEFKEKNPAYADVPDVKLARALHAKYYSEMPFSEFSAQVGYRAPGAPAEAVPTRSVPEELVRQAGLTGRHVLEGVGDTADLLASPVRAGLNAMGMDIQGRSGKTLADYLKLPQPETPTERVVGDVSRLVAGSAGVVGTAGKAASAATGTTQKVLQALAARPGLQAASAVGAGAAGGATREAGGGELAQLVASLVGGVAAPMAVSGGMRVATAVKDRLKPKQVAEHIDQIINEALPKGFTVEELTGSVRDTLRKDIKGALSKGELTPDVVRRLADYRLTGLTPTAGPLTLDPGIVTRQKNLAALGVSSSDPRLQALANVENANARKMVENINALGADTTDDALAAGQKIMEGIQKSATAQQTKIGELYDAVRDSSGRSALLDGKAFVKNAKLALKENMGMEFLPASIKNRLDDLASGKEPLTVEAAETIKTVMGKIQRNSQDGNVRHAIGTVRAMLDKTPLIGTRGEDTVKAANAARAAYREFAATVEKTPALQAVLDGMEPDKFVQQYIIGSSDKASVAAVANLKKQLIASPEAVTVVKKSIAKHLKDAALGGKADELAKFSSTGYNKAVKSIGDAKLSMFFAPDEIAAIKALGRVASYEQFQPTGSAVNNSKTAAAVISTVLDRIGSSALIRKIPLGAEVVANPLRSVAAGGEAGRLLNIPTTQIERQRFFPLPAVLAPFLNQEE